MEKLSLFLGGVLQARKLYLLYLSSFEAHAQQD
jgi:hypothetical protein